MSGLKVLPAAVILAFVLFTGGLTFESTHLARGQFFEDSVTNVTDTDTNVTDTDTNSSPMGSEIVLLSQKLKKESFGSRHVIGQVKNIGHETADYVLVHLTVYNKEGGVIATNEGYAEPSTLKAGQKSTFEIFADTDDFKGMDYYTLSLDWLNHRDSAQGYVEDAQLYESTPNPTESDVNGAQEKKIPTENPITVPKSKKSYQLIIYLDNASTQNAIGDNFKILVYNSNDEPILSAKPNIDFNDDHQKISPPKGYPIIYRSEQYPKDINVCAQQEYQLNGTTKLHDDCYPIIQNVQKTYWYTIFDYGEIDGFEADSNSIAKSNEMTPTTDTITPDNKAESNNQDAGNNGQGQGNEVTVTIVQGSADAGSGENKYNGSSHAGYGFDPPELTVEKGTIVKWINNDISVHTVTSGKPSSGQLGLAFDSSYLNAGESYLHKFNSKKTYDYYCTMYPFMKGKIIVK